MARVKLLVGGDRGRFPYSNCLLVEGARARVLVDAGCGHEVLASLSGVDAVVYTHVHPDHIWGHGLLPGGVPVLVPEADYGYRSLESLALRYAPEAAGEWLDYVDTVFSLREPPAATGYYSAWEEVRIGDVSIQTIPARGHTRGHNLLLVDGHLHLSDVDLTGFGPWYGHPESSLHAFAADIALAEELAAEARSVSTSHREKVFTPQEALEELARYKASLCRQLASVANAASQGPARPRGLAGRGVIYRRYVPGMEAIMRYFEEAMIEEALTLLQALGAARRTREGFQAMPERVPDACRRLGITLE